MNESEFLGAWYYARGLRYSGLRIFRRDSSRTDTRLRVSLIDPYFGQSPGDALQRSVLDLPHHVLDVDMLVMRGVSREHDFERLARAVQDRTSRETTIALLEFPLSDRTFAAPRIFPCVGAIPLPEPAAIIELRDLELSAQLNWSGAIQTPASAHFELPAGTHASGFHQGW